MPAVCPTSRRWRRNTKTCVEAYSGYKNVRTTSLRRTFEELGDLSLGEVLRIHRGGTLRYALGTSVTEHRQFLSHSYSDIMLSRIAGAFYAIPQHTPSHYDGRPGSHRSRLCLDVEVNRQHVLDSPLGRVVRSWAKCSRYGKISASRRFRAFDGSSLLVGVRRRI